MKHIIPQDYYNHIQSISCGCNPTIGIIEGEELCIHNEVPIYDIETTDIAGRVRKIWISTNTQNIGEE